MILLPVLLFARIAWPVSCDRCPSPALKNRYAVKSCTDSTYYHCVWNLSKKDYVDVCSKPQLFTAGSYVIFAGNLDAEECPHNRYQPFSFQTNERNACVYLKSKCTEEGQITAANGSTTTDATCKCDYTKGYSYVDLPGDPCNCKPSEEDCSCYMTNCLNVTHSLSQDYQCEEKNSDVLRQYHCPKITSRSKETVNPKPKYTIDVDNMVKDSVNTSVIAYTIIGMVMVLLIVLCTAVYIGILWYKLDSLKAVIDRSKKCHKKIMKEGLVTDLKTFKHATKMTENNSVILLKGRRGTGKTALANHLASVYIKQKYKLAILGREDRETITEIQRSSEKFVIILEEWFDVSPIESEVMLDVFDTGNFENDSVVILTAAHLDENNLEQLRVKEIVSDNNMINLDQHSLERIEDNQSILRFMLSKYNKELSDDAIIEAAKTNTYYGFPHLCVLFCQEDRIFELGSNFFCQPLMALIDIVNSLKSSGKQQDRIMYCILAYILLAAEPGKRVNGFKIADMKNIFQKVYDNSPSLSEDDVKNASVELNSKRLISTMNNEHILSPVVRQAVMLSYAEVGLDEVIEKCDFDQILDIVSRLIYDNLDLPDYTPTTFVLTFGLIALRKSGQNDLVDTLVDKYIISGNKQTAVEILKTVVDQYNNTFLHYCVLWWYNKDDPFIKYLDIQLKELLHDDECTKNAEENHFEILNKENKSAVDVAAYFGNYELLNIFIELKFRFAQTQSLPAIRKRKLDEVTKELFRLKKHTEDGKTNDTINNYESCPFINKTVCGDILVDVNDTFDYDKTAVVINSHLPKC